MSGPPAPDPGRVVVVAAGFALWTGGRCVAAARWSDIRRLRAYYRTGGASPDAVCLGVELVDGSAMELREEAPGFEAFLDRGAATLPGLLPHVAWRGALDAAARADGVVIFERTTRRYERGR